MTENGYENSKPKSSREISEKKKEEKANIFLPSFIMKNDEIDEYFNNSNSDDESDEKKESDFNSKNNEINHNNIIMSNHLSNKDIFNNKNFQNISFSPIFTNGRSIYNNSFNNNRISHYYDNFFPVSNISNNVNHHVNNINISNNYMNSFCNSFQPMYKATTNFNNVLNFHNIFSSTEKQIPKNYSFNSPYGEMEKKSKKEENNKHSSNIKKVLNMAEYSFYNFLVTQKGSRVVQKALKHINAKEIDILIDKLKTYIRNIAMDKYGNYFIQKLILICSPSQRIKIIHYLQKCFIEVARSPCGTHPLQYLMEKLDTKEEKKLVLSYILGHELDLSNDSRGTHVLQKFLNQTTDGDRYELNQNIIKLIDKLIVDAYGVCVLIKLIKNTKDKSIAQRISDYIITKGALPFIQHPYANYVVQCLFNLGDISLFQNIIGVIVDNYLSLSIQKFSSNIVESCLKHAESDIIKKLFQKIVEDNKLETLLNNNYGNFVVEKLVAKLNQDEKNVLIKIIENSEKNINISSTLSNLLYNSI